MLRSNIFEFHSLRKFDKSWRNYFFLTSFIFPSTKNLQNNCSTRKFSLENVSVEYFQNSHYIAITHIHTQQTRLPKKKINFFNFRKFSQKSSLSRCFHRVNDFYPLFPPIPKNANTKKIEGGARKKRKRIFPFFRSEVLFSPTREKVGESFPVCVNGWNTHGQMG